MKLKFVNDGNILLSPRNKTVSVRSFQRATITLLTPCETEVLSLLSDGYSSHQVADLLFVSENTVEYHRKQILCRLGARNNV